MFTVFAAINMLDRHVLPARFGGAPGDYQLVEVDGEAQSEMLLRISPRARVSDVAAVRDVVLARVADVHGGSLSQRLWRFTGGMRVAVEEPEPTATGKIHAVRLRRDERGLDANTAKKQDV